MNSPKFWHIETYKKSYVVQANTLKQAFKMINYCVDVDDVIKIFETFKNVTKEHSPFELLN